MEFVPRNARVLVRGSPTDHFVLRSNVDPVALDTQPSSVPGWVWVSARELLSVGVIYRIEPEAAARSATPPPSIKVLDLEDHGPLTAADVTIAPVASTNSCKSSVAASVNVGWLLDPEDTRGFGVYYAQLEVTVDGVTETTMLRLRSGVRVTGLFGRDECQAVASVGIARTGVAASARITFYDQAGNATETGPLDFEFGEAKPLECRMAAGNSGAAGAPVAGAPGMGTADAAGSRSLAVARAAEHVESCGVARARRSTSTIGLLLLAAAALVQLRRFTGRRARRGSARSRPPS